MPTQSAARAKPEQTPSQSSIDALTIKDRGVYRTIYMSAFCAYLGMTTHDIRLDQPTLQVLTDSLAQTGFTRPEPNDPNYPVSWELSCVWINAAVSGLAIFESSLGREGEGTWQRAILSASDVPRMEEHPDKYLTVGQKREILGSLASGLWQRRENISSVSNDELQDLARIALPIWWNEPHIDLSRAEKYADTLGAVAAQFYRPHS